jgi:hypothetical protein
MHIMHIIDLAYDDIPVRIKVGKSGIIDVQMEGTTGVLLYKAYMPEVMRWLAMKAADVKRKGSTACPDCGEDMDYGNCHWCGFHH